MPGPGRPHGFPDADIGVGSVVNVKLPSGKVVPILWDGSFSIETDLLSILKSQGINAWEVADQPVPQGKEGVSVGRTDWKLRNFEFAVVDKPLQSVQPTLKGAGEAPSSADVEIKENP